MSAFNEGMQEVLSRLEDEAFVRAAAPKPRAEPRNARFTIAWEFDGTKSATVTINRRAGTIEVRPLRRRRTYTLPLADVARLISERIIKAEAAAKRKARRVRR